MGPNTHVLNNCLFSRCSRFETEIMRLRIVRPVRVCQACYHALKDSKDNMKELLPTSGTNNPAPKDQHSDVLLEGVPPGTAPSPQQRAAMLNATRPV